MSGVAGGSVSGVTTGSQTMNLNQKRQIPMVGHGSQTVVNNDCPFGTAWGASIPFVSFSKGGMSDEKAEICVTKGTALALLKTAIQTDDKILQAQALEMLALIDPKFTGQAAENVIKNLAEQCRMEAAIQVSPIFLMTLKNMQDVDVCALTEKFKGIKQYALKQDVGSMAPVVQTQAPAPVNVTVNLDIDAASCGKEPANDVATPASKLVVPAKKTTKPLGACLKRAPAPQ